MKLIAALILPALLFAQPTKVTRMIEYEPDGTDQMRKFEPLLVHLNVAMRTEPLVRLVSLQGPDKDSVDEAERIIRRYYKPKVAKNEPDRNVELTLRILQGRNSPDPSDIPITLASVVTQLKQASQLTSFRLLESQILRIRDGAKVGANGVISWMDVPELVSPTYTFSSMVRLSGNTVQLDDLHFNIRMPVKGANENYSFRDVGISSTLDLTPVQQVVVGKTNASAKDGAIILVLSARIVD